MAFSRRSFLLGASGAFGLAASATALDKFSLLERAALAAPTGLTGYRALVCVFLQGGNDANNMIIPLAGVGGATYATYAQVRDSAANIGILDTDLTPLNPPLTGQAAFGLHPSMPKLAGLYTTDKKLAFVTNVGSIRDTLGTTTQFQDQSENLFSHSDQQAAAAMGVANPAARSVTSGWGGRAADLVTLNNPVQPGPNLRYPEVTFFGGIPVYGSGPVTKSLAIPENGKLQIDPTGSAPLNRIRTAALGSMQSTLLDYGAVAGAYSTIFDGGRAFAAGRTDAIAGIPAGALTIINQAFTGVTGSLGVQLRQIAIDMVAGASTETASGKVGLGMKRQIFAAALGGFDTHSDELATHEDLYSQLDDALYAFHTSIAQINAAAFPTVQPILETLFTQSDFARTFKPNSTGGSDHGWGSHMIVLGDSVVGGKMYGTFPSLTIGGIDDVGEGRWLPTTSVDQYANTLTRWFGITSVADQNTMFPNLVNFPTKKLGFLG
jgi:uncharacterized protein (DUF1501 family)